MRFATAFMLTSALVLAACGEKKPEGQTSDAQSATATPTAAADSYPATPEGADKFVADVNADLKRMQPYFSSAQWLQATYITDDSQLIAARATEEYLAWQAKRIEQSKIFNGVQGLKPETARAIMLLKNVSAPAPSDPKLQSELATILSRMEANYGAGKWCRAPNDCLNLSDIEKIIDDPKQTPDARLAAWKGWHETARAIRKDYQRFVELVNQGAKEMGKADAGEVWRSGYDMPPAAFAAETERLWTQVKPLYNELHCYVRGKLNAKYGDSVVPKDGLIPAHLLGNMWAQEWSNIYPLVEPYPGVAALDVTAALKKQRDAEFARIRAENRSQTTPVQIAELSHQADADESVKMAKVAEDFYTSLGMPSLPPSFWEKSMLTRPRDRDVVCHASAWDLNMQGDVRIKMCIDPKEEDLITIHHELGHIYYDLMYNPLPPIFQDAAHDGFHEAIGDTITLSLTPAHLHRIGLVGPQKADPKAVINAQMKWAVAKIVFLPWGKLVDQWRWKVFSGEVTPENYNAAWWKLREDYQGVAPPTERSEENFDPGAKYHVAGNTPYTRYFLSFIIQFQFQKALCEAAGYTGPLNECDVYGNKEAGERFMAMLKAGASRPWPETLEKLTGTRQMDGSALIEYFAPLMAYLKEQNEGKQCGWGGQ
ncbi:MAG: peptidase M2 family protein [Alphaproteobacteria bacterium]|nr:peptidase M2 family protein [Alphaproteobacteria bacterium]